MKNLLPARNAVQVLYMALALRLPPVRQPVPPVTSRQFDWETGEPVEADLVTSPLGWGGAAPRGAPLYVQEIDT